MNKTIIELYNKITAANLNDKISTRQGKKIMKTQTKNYLLKEFDRLCEEKGVRIEGIYSNCNKSHIENAINCLVCDDATLDDYMTVFKMKYPNSYKAISANGNWKLHSYNRLYIYNSARLILA